MTYILNEIKLRNARGGSTWALLFALLFANLITALIKSQENYPLDPNEVQLQLPPLYAKIQWRQTATCLPPPLIIPDALANPIDVLAKLAASPAPPPFCMTRAQYQAIEPMGINLIECRMREIPICLIVRAEVSHGLLNGSLTIQNGLIFCARVPRWAARVPTISARAVVGRSAVRCLLEKNSHHIIEATFKAFARALRQATEYDPRRRGTVPSSKGVLSRT